MLYSYFFPCHYIELDTNSSAGPRREPPWLHSLCCSHSCTPGHPSHIPTPALTTVSFPPCSHPKPNAPPAGPTWHVTAGHGVTQSWGRSDRSMWVPLRCGCTCKPLLSPPPSLLLLPLKLMKPCDTTFSCTSPSAWFESFSLQISKGCLVVVLGTQLWMSLFGQGLGQRDTEVPGSLSHSVIPWEGIFMSFTEHYHITEAPRVSIEFNSRDFLGEAPWRTESLVKLLLHPSGTPRCQWRLQAEPPIIGSAWCFSNAW